ncbi:hypothetical protein EUGRSUZ_H02504 [Eucalyptus grandis]|uniref:Uncharacterized protein n=2 Tax=Eucalyptus grandis TaxID=71139 RepID=A0ACC3JR66_EUCGR|nr:hypothetical protein EUGRSUZ_H02504 [Eucalyptus grandis]
MGRGRTPHGLVPNARARRIAYEKRKNGLMKKAREFSVLCGVDTCVVVFPEAAAGVDRPIAPEVWPPDHGEARRIIERYRSASRDALADRKKKKKKKEKLDLAEARRGERGEEGRDGGRDLGSVQRRRPERRRGAAEDAAPGVRGRYAGMGRRCSAQQRSLLVLLRRRRLGNPRNGGGRFYFLPFFSDGDDRFLTMEFLLIFLS